MKKILFVTFLSIVLLFPFALELYSDKKTVITEEIKSNNDTQALSDTTVEKVEANEIFSNPSRLVIPKLDIDAQVEFVGEDDEGRMDVPKKDENVAWWKLGVIPGQQGSAVIAGHYDKKDGGPAVFYNLGNLNIGDEIRIVDEEGVTRVFKVFRKEVFKDETFPLQEVFADNSGERLNLITCEGVFDSASKNYSDRLVVFSELSE